MGRQHALLGVLLLTGFLLAPVQSSIMAVDLGSENLKVSLIKPGRTPISIVVNEMSKRKTPALVGFANAERLLGEEAASFAVRYPDTTILRARDLLAKPHDDPTISAMLKEHNLPYSVVSHPVRKQAAIKLKDGTHVSAEELVVSRTRTHRHTYRHGRTQTHADAQDTRRHIQARQAERQHCTLRFYRHIHTRAIAALRLRNAAQASQTWYICCVCSQASIIHYARQIAEAQSGAPVLDAVIAVPAYFGQVSNHHTSTWSTQRVLLYRKAREHLHACW